MKQTLIRWGSVCIAVALCIFFALVLLTYSQPMEDRIYDLSFHGEDAEGFFSHIPSSDPGASLGWTVFTQEGETRTQLTYDGFGCYDALSYAGQTFYFSRVMTEKLDAPTLRLATANRTFSVFLDNVLIHTDCPQENNRIGYLTLPMRELDKTEDITIPLPEDYLGKTLTIAQSTPTIAETPSMATKALPCSVKLYCDYAYESALISESFQTAILSSSGYLLGVVTVFFFLRRLQLGKVDLGLAALALSIFLIITAQLYSVSYAYKYFGTRSGIDLPLLCYLLMLSSLMIFLASRAPSLRSLAWTLSGLCCVGVVGYAVFPRLFPFPDQGLPHLLTHSVSLTLLYVTLGMMLLLSWLRWRKENGFHRFFAPLTGACVAIYLVIRLLLDPEALFESFVYFFQGTFYLRLLSSLMLVVSICLTAFELIRGEFNRYTSKRLAVELGEMAQQRYENLRLHNAQIMMLRHDMLRHFQLLRQMTSDEKTAEYLDELIGQNEKIRPILQSGHEMLDIILSSRLSTAAEAGIRLEIVRAQAPAALPISDADLCSLMMNLLDNAVAAARSSGAAQPYLKLDLHVKNGFLVFICENTADMRAPSAQNEKTVQKHGWGLQIVEQIAERCGALLQTEIGADYYKTTLALPLSHASR